MRGFVRQFAHKMVINRMNGMCLKMYHKFISENILQIYFDIFVSRVKNAQR